MSDMYYNLDPRIMNIKIIKGIVEKEGLLEDKQMEKRIGKELQFLKEIIDKEILDLKKEGY